MIPRTREEKFLHRGSVEDYADPLLGIKHYNRFLCHGSMEKFLHRGSVERVLHHGSTKDYTDLLLGIKHHTRLLKQEIRSSYTVQLWKGSYTVKHRRLCRSFVGYRAP